MEDSSSKVPSEKDATSPDVSGINRSSLNDPARGSEKSPDAGATSSSGASEVPKPVGFTTLFRFATKWELLLDAVGLVAAMASGATQPLMSLIFGRLTQDFVLFLTAANNASSPDPEVREQANADLPELAADFRRAAASNAALLVYIGIGMMASTYIYMTAWVYTAEVNAKRVRERYLKAILRQDIAFFDNVGAGEVATRIQTDTHLVHQGISEKVPLVFSYMASFFTGFILAYARSWRLALALSSIIPCIAISGAVMNYFISKYMQLSLKIVAEAGSIAEEVISSIRTVKAFSSQSTLSAKYDSYNDKARKADVKISIWLGGSLAVFFFVLYGSYSLAFTFGSRLINQGHADVEAVLNVLLAILIGSFALAGMAPELQAIQQACGAAAKLFQAIDRVPPIDSQDPSGDKPSDLEGEITLQDVKFNYPSRPDVPVLKGISLIFRAGKTTALVGASGSGKSTIVSLVERFYDPLSGTVTLDGMDLKSLNLKWLRSQIGLVSQEPVLFATTIKQNVAFGLIGTPYEHTSDDEKFTLVKQACVKANADGFISKLPQGYDTMVGERGFLLSGGQKQRVAIARAIASDPRILLLDEATSALDTQSEGIVQDALEKASAGRTTITIAHRLSTIKDADVIFVMGDGLVLEQGTHNELLAKSDGAYARLVQAQKLREEETIDAAEDDADSASSSEGRRDMEKAAEDEVPLGRKNTSESLASEILENRQKQTPSEKTQDLGLPTLFRRMGYINRDVWWRYGIGTVAAILAGLAAPAYGIVFSLGIEGFSYEGAARQRAGDRTALWFFIIAIVSVLCIGSANYSFDSSAAILLGRLRSLIFKAILRQDVEFFDQGENSSGTLTSNLSEKPQKVKGLAGITLEAIIQALSTYIAGCLLGLAFAWKVALVGIATSPFLLCTGYAHLRIVVLKDEANKKAHEESAQLACEAAASIRTVASLTMEQDCCDTYSRSLEQPLRQSTKTAIWSNFVYSLSQATMFFVIALVFWYGSRLVAAFELSTFRFFVALMATTFGAQQAGGALAFVPDISSAKGSGSDIIRLLDSVPEIDSESPDGKPVASEKTQGHIQFDNVHFRYPTRPDVRVLRNLTLEVKPGTYVALVGASGCGKSTTIQLIERFYDPLAGHIYLDGVPISELNLQDYRKQIALVSQEPTLYAGSVRFNVLLGAIKPHEEVTQSELEDACRDANILDFIKGLPNGFDTEVGGKGSQLSGGQKQRIAIARALIRNPKILLLDEATSALDSHSEKVVQDALDKAAKGRTTIAIAHRLSTIQNADCIYFIKEGSVSEAGSHDELLSRRGDYYEYVQLQALSRR